MHAFYCCTYILHACFLLLHANISVQEKIIEFFRKFTVNEPGVGDICKFATFPLQEHGNKKYGVASDSAKQQLHTKHGKLEKSFLNFKANHPEWKPSEDGEKYLSDLERSIHSSPDFSNDNNSTTTKSALFSSTVSVMTSLKYYKH
jgi:hypothetical protein